MAEAENVRKPPRWGRRIGFSLLGFVALLIVGHAIWGWYQERQLVREVEELRRTGEPILPEDFKKKTVAEEENTAVALMRAAKAMDQSSKTLERFGWIALELPLSEKELAIVRPALAENKQALEVAREARGKSAVDWKVEVKRPLMLLDEATLKGQDDLAQLMCAAALVAHQEGRDAEAVEFVLDLLRQADAIEHAPTWTSHLQAIKVLHRGLDAGAQIAADLRVGEGRAGADKVTEMIRRLLDASAMREGTRSSLRFERAKNLDTAMAIERGQVLRPGMPARSEFSAGGYLYKPLLMNDGRVMLRHGTLLLAAAEAENFPAYRKQMRAGEQLADWVDRNRKWHPLAGIGIPLDQSIANTGREYRALCDRRMVALALAIRLYAAEHGEAMPRKVEELSPRYLPAILVDPYAEQGNALRYLAEEKRPIVYSVGENGTDEGGSERPLRASAIRYRWEQEDAVLHLSRQPRERKSFYESKEGGYIEDDSGGDEREGK